MTDDRNDSRPDDRKKVRPSAGGEGGGAGEHGPLGDTDMRSGAARVGGSSGVSSGLQHAGTKPSNAGFGGVGEFGTAGGSAKPEARPRGTKSRRKAT